jgi:peroxiredoxin
LVAISPQLESFNRDMSLRHKLAFDVLSDPGNRVASEFGLTFELPEDLRQLYAKFGIDLKKYNGDESWTLPMPARFVIDSGGTVRAADADPDYTVRPEPAETVRVLEALKSDRGL